MTNGMIPDDFQILQNVNFDPMDILHGGKALDPNTPIVKIKKGDDADDDDDADDRRQKQQTKAPQIEISEEMLTQGLSNARALGSNNVGGPGGPGSKKQDNNTDNNADQSKQGKQGTSATKTGSDSPDDVYNAHYRMMVELGKWEEVEDFDGTEEKYIEAAETNRLREVEKGLDDYFDEAFEKNPDGKALGIKLFKHLQANGKLSDFKALYEPAEFKFEDLKSSDDVVAEAASKELIRNYYSRIGWKTENINSRITNLEKTGRLIDEATEVEEPYKDLLAHQQNLYQKNLERNKAENTKNRQHINTTLHKLIENNTAFGSVQPYANKKEREELEDYYFTATENNNSAFNEDLNEALQDPLFLLYLGVSLKKKLYKDPKAFAQSDENASSQATSKLKSTLQNALLNKNINNSGFKDDVSQPASTGKYKFNLDEAVVIS
jgi:hypothetical protein